MREVVHSKTLPARSWMPCGLSPAGVAPTAHVPVSGDSPDQQTLPLGLSLPQG